MAATNLRFVILGDDRGSGAFSRFARQVDQANRAVDRNSKILQTNGQIAGHFGAQFGGLGAIVTGVADAMLLCNRSAGLFARGVAGLNLVTGLLEPEIAALTVGVGALSSAFGAAGVGMVGYGLVLKNVMSTMEKLKQLQEKAATGNKKAQQALQQFVKGLSPAFKAFDAQLETTKTQYRNWATALEGPVLSPLTAGLKLVNPLLHALTPAVEAAAGAIRFLIQDLSADIAGGGFARWIRSMRPTIWTSIVNGGRTVINIIKGIGGILSAFAPMAGRVTGGIERMSEKFAAWGQTLTKHSGFQSLISMVKADMPYITAILKNLAVIFLNVGKSMASLATPANSKALLQVLSPLVRIFAQLSQNRVLVQTVLYLLMMRSAWQKINPLIDDGARLIGKVSDNWDTWSGFLSKGRTQLVSWGGSLVTALAGIKTWTIWARLAAAAQKVWNAVQIAFNVIMHANPIVLIITAIVALVAIVIICYKRFKWFRDFVQAVWQAILVAVRAVVSWFQSSFIPFFTKTVPAAWGVVLNAGRALWRGIQAGWNACVHAVRVVVAAFVDRILGFFGMILHGAAVMWGWVPKLGEKLREADRKFQQFRDNVNRSILGIRGQTVGVNVKFVTGTGQAKGTHTAGGRGSGGYSGGGLVRGPGGPTADQAGPVWLSDKEYVHNAAAVHYYGQAFMDAVNARRYPRMAQGGIPYGGGRYGGVLVKPHTPNKPAIEAAVMPPVRELAKIWAKSGAFSALGQVIAQMALRYLGVPYVWGGTTPAGWDCSGMTSWLYRRAGITDIPRTAAAQQHWSRHIGYPVTGALAFFAGAYGTARDAGHVGIIIGPHTMVNAAGTGIGTIISSFGFPEGGIGVPPGRAFARGGWIHEPTLGIGLRTGRLSSFAERGAEYVSSADMGRKLDLLAALLGDLIGAVDDNADRTAAGVAGAIGGGRTGPMYAALYGAR